MRDGTVPHGPALLADERVEVVVADVARRHRGGRRASYDLVLLDVDNGPGYLVHDANAALYGRRSPRARPGARCDPAALCVDLVGRPRPGPARRDCAEVFGDAEATAYDVDLQDRAEQYWLHLARVPSTA